MDQEINGRLTWAIQHESKKKGRRKEESTTAENFRQVEWKDVQVGAVLLLHEDEPLPADVIVMATSDPVAGLCYIETANLDGETNLKNRESVEDIQRHLHLTVATSKKPGDTTPPCVLSTEDVHFLRSLVVECEPPNDNLHAFTGSIIVLDPPPHPNPEVQQPNPLRIGLSNKQVIYRGCTLRNTKWALGLVVFTGMETKLMMNNIEKRLKRTTLDRLTNRYLVGIFTALAVLCVAAGIVSGLFIRSQNLDSADSKLWYLPREDRKWQAQLFLNMVTFVILLNTLIPISLTVTMEMVKVGHAYLIGSDLAMCFEDVHSGQVTPARARTSNLAEDLGRIEYIFSDKTGTLTQNVMEFMKCCVNGIAYGSGTTEIGRAAARREGKDPESAGDERAGRRPEGLILQPGDNFYDQRVSLQGWRKNIDRDKIRQFFLHLAVCHTVMAKPREGDEADEKAWHKSNLQYQASSPDEEALVIGAKGSGFCFKRRNYKDVIVEIDCEDGRTEELVYQVLNINEFSSARKRMSAAVREPSGQIWLLVKGADSIVFERLAPPQGQTGPNSKDMLELTKGHLRTFANEGLRTLVLAQRKLTEQEYQAWNGEFVEAFTAIQNREDRLADVAERVEVQLELVGATAIEDKLQDGVPQCIATLGKANIQIWVLTGDKVETAINIAMACNLIDTKTHLEKVSLPDQHLGSLDGESAQQRTQRLAEQRKERYRMVVQQLERALAERDRVPSTSALTTSPRSGPVRREAALIIDGHALEFALQHEQEVGAVPGKLLELCSRCKAVVCCRVSPKQKADVVELVRTKRKVITLGIGDGANDVGMITKAHIGVGISGKEGVQAVMASDYAIAQFRYLQRLVLVHGRWNCQRISLAILFFFFKNVAFAVPTFWFGIHTAFSGETFWDDIYQSVWNVVFTAVPILSVALFDKDMVRSETLEKYPRLYAEVQSGKDFTAMRFLMWSVEGLWASVVVYFAVTYIMAGSTRSDGQDSGKWLVSFTAFAVCHTAANLRLAFATKTWNKVTAVLTILSVLTYYLFSLVYSYFPIGFAKHMNHMFGSAVSNPGFWLTLLLAQAVILLPGFAANAVHRLFWPTATDIVAEAEQGKRNSVSPTVQSDEVTGKGNTSTAHIKVHEKYERPPTRSGTGDAHEGMAVIDATTGQQTEFLGYGFSQEQHADVEVDKCAYAPNPDRRRKFASGVAVPATLGSLAGPTGSGLGMAAKPRSLYNVKDHVSVSSVPSAEAHADEPSPDQKARRPVPMPPPDNDDEKGSPLRIGASIGIGLQRPQSQSQATRLRDEQQGQGGSPRVVVVQAAERTWDSGEPAPPTPPQAPRPQSRAGVVATPLDSSQSVYLKACTVFSTPYNPAFARTLSAVPGNFNATSLIVAAPAHRLGSKGIRPVLEVLRSNRKVTHFVAKGQDLHSETVEWLVEVGMAHPSLQSIDLSDNLGLGDSAGKALVRLAMHNPNLDTINLENTKLSPAIRQTLLNVLGSNRTRRLSQAAAAHSKSGDAGRYVVPPKKEKERSS
eukprot:TRINITY_DN3592_c0_g2_i1.p1 TRINITY_DN3592_c0_g2~~TRINITY_DN3592_c0_g2_i1.p1  ORF type:complete len:1641 (+),score=299.86 TRINITY_DN3592_c0_g2_i1:355-4923(+)